MCADARVRSSRPRSAGDHRRKNRLRLERRLRCGLFPEPFSGDPDRPYSEFYAALKATGDYTLVGDPAQADLVLELRLVAPYGPSEANKQKGASDPLPMFRVVIYDGKSHYILWTATSSIELAYLQKTHDKNFDTALTEVLNQFLKIAGKPPAAAH
jgi:hypothetical protein